MRYGLRNGKLLRVFVGEDERLGSEPLYAAIVEAFLEAGFAGATVFKGIEGLGVRGEVIAVRSVVAMYGLPVVIEAVEEEAKLRPFLPKLTAMVPEGLLTLEDVEMARLDQDAGR